MLAALFAGSLTAIASGVGIAWIVGADLVTLKSLASKSVTTPIASAFWPVTASSSDGDSQQREMLPYRAT
jgi:putative effector of murein hydrolase